jgi:hypothetical protein
MWGHVIFCDLLKVLMNGILLWGLADNLFFLNPVDLLVRVHEPLELSLTVENVLGLPLEHVLGLAGLVIQVANHLIGPELVCYQLLITVVVYGSVIYRVIDTSH